jgi:hypothetical protein
MATSMRGPTMYPALIALRNETSMYSLDPTSRTVVTPASIVLRAYVDASSACSP